MVAMERSRCYRRGSHGSDGPQRVGLLLCEDPMHGFENVLHHFVRGVVRVIVAAGPQPSAGQDLTQKQNKKTDAGKEET